MQEYMEDINGEANIEQSAFMKEEVFITNHGISQPFLQQKHSKSQITKFFQNNKFQGVNFQNQKILADVAQLYQKRQQTIQLNFGTLFVNLQTQVFKKTLTKSPMCSKIMKKSDKAFKCRQCMLEDNSILCLQCFQKSDHRNHFYEMTDVYGGCCDCGDQEKWKKSGFCYQHHEENVEAPVDQKKYDIFSKQMQFYVYLLFVLYQNERKFKGDPNEKKQIQFFSFQKYGAKLLENLIEFNKNSMISNKMTVTFFDSNLSFGQSKNERDITAQLRFLEVYPQAKRKCIFAYLMMLQEVQEISRLIVDLFTLLFQIKDFKKNLAEQVFHRVSKSKLFLQSEFSSLTCQVFTSHRIVSQLIDEGKIRPISLNCKDGLEFQKMANLYVRYYIDLKYLSNLSSGSAEKYLQFHIANDDISKLGGYRELADLNHSQTIDFWGLQTIALQKFQIIVQKIKHKTKSMQKMIRDLYQFVTNYKPKHNGQNLDVYIPQERMLSLCMWTYLKGDVESLKNQSVCIHFLKILGVLEHQNELQKQSQMNDQTKKKFFIFQVKKIIKRVQRSLNVSASVLSNQKYQERFYTYFSFMFKKKHLILSLDFNLINLFAYLLEFRAKGMTNIGDLLKFKTAQDFFQIDLTQVESQNQSYERKKMLSAYVENIAFITELSSRNLHQLTLASITGVGQSSFISFYYRMHKIIGEVQLKALKIVKGIFFQQSVFFERYVKECTEQQKNKLKPSQEKVKNVLKITDSFPLESLSYFASRKILMTDLLGDKFKPYEDQFAQIKQNQKQLRVEKFYTKQNILKVMKVIKRYFDFFKHHEKPEQLNILNKLLLQLLKIRYVVGSQCKKNIDKFFKEIILNHQSRIKLVDGRIKVKIEKMTKTNSEGKTENQNDIQIKEVQARQRKEKIKEIQRQKIQQLKKKQARISNKMQFQSGQAQKLQQSQINTQKRQQKEQNNVCLFCYCDAQKDPLFYLASMIRSNQYGRAFSRVRLQDQPDSHLVFTSCYHLIHRDCFYQNFGMRDFVSCLLCKSTANVLLPYIPNNDKNMSVNTNSINNKIFHDTGKLAIQRLEVINATLKARVPDKNMLIQGQQKKQPPIQHQILDSLVKVCVGVGLTRKDFYFKRLAKITRSLLYLYLQHVGIQNFMEEVKCKIKRLQKQAQTSSSEAFQIIDLERIFLITLGKAIYKQKSQGNYLFSINKIVNQLIGQASMSISSMETKIQSQLFPMMKAQEIPSLINILNRQKYYLPKELLTLWKQVGKCPNCQLPTNLIYICLLCKWKGCQNCRVKKLLIHAVQVHQAVTVFVRVDTGNIVYLADKRGLTIDSIYQDFFGQPYKNGNIGSVNRDKYLLNVEKQAQIHRNIDQFSIQKVIRYAEITKNKAGLINIHKF